MASIGMCYRRGHFRIKPGAPERSCTQYVGLGWELKFVPQLFERRVNNQEAESCVAFQIKWFQIASWALLCYIPFTSKEFLDFLFLMKNIVSHNLQSSEYCWTISWHVCETETNHFSWRDLCSLTWLVQRSGCCFHPPGHTHTHALTHGLFYYKPCGWPDMLPGTQHLQLNVPIFFSCCLIMFDWAIMVMLIVVNEMLILL